MNHLSEHKGGEKRSRKALVIGAGIGGLAAAIRLACKGYDVTVLEAAAVAGGKLRSRNVGAYRFDTGPSLLTMPEEIDALFYLAGKNPRDYFNYHTFDTSCHYYWQDGMRFIAPTDPDRFSEEAALQFNIDRNEIQQYLTHAKKVFHSVGDIFLKKSLHHYATWLSASAFQAFKKIKIADLLWSMNTLNQQRLSSPHLVQLFNRFATYNGSDPFQAPGLLHMIAALEHGQGVYFPKGGMIAIPQSLQRLAESIGVKFLFHSLVTKIETNNKKVKGVWVGDVFYGADIVVSNMDIWHTWPRLLPEWKPPQRTLNQERSSSALVFYCGVNSTFPDLGLHNIFFSENQKKEFEQIFKQGQLPEDPTVYIHISSRAEPEDAPLNSENWFILVNAPCDTGQDWDGLAEAYLNKILMKISQHLGQDLSSKIDGVSTWTPATIASETLSFGGALYGSSSNSRYAAFLRHANKNPHIKGLFHVGGTVHPGGGIPLCLRSAKIATDQINPL